MFDVPFDGRRMYETPWLTGRVPGSKAHTGCHLGAWVTAHVLEGLSVLGVDVAQTALAIALRTRASRREDPLDVHVPDPIIRAISHGDEGPETDAMLADSVGLALLVVL